MGISYNDGFYYSTQCSGELREFPNLIEISDSIFVLLAVPLKCLLSTKLVALLIREGWTL